MNKKKIRKPQPLTKKKLEEAVENLADLSDLSDYDSEDDNCFANSICSPSASNINQPDEYLIEHRLEEIFGIEDNLDDDNVEDEPVLQTTRSDLLSILDDQSQNATIQNTDGNVFEQDTSSSPLHVQNTVRNVTEQDTSNSPLHVQELCTQDQGSPSSHDIQPEIVDIPEQVATTQRPGNMFEEDIDIDDLMEDDQEESQNHNVVPRDRSRPRDWKTADLTHDIPVFDKRFKPKFQDTHKTQPLTVFERFFPDKLILIIAEQTNRYAVQKESANWKPVTEEDIRAYLGVLIMMGLNPLPDFELYWSSDPFYYNKEIAQVFPIVRFKKITENLHLNDNEMQPPRDSPDHDKLYKVRPLITELNKVYQRQAYNSSVQSIDECMVKFKGRSTLKQYMPKKPIKRGFKIWARCDAKTGYLYQFEVYTGKGDSTENDGLGYNVVTKLCINVPGNTLVAFDNFFTSVPLMEDLFDRNIFAVGTVRSNKKYLPDVMKNKKQPKQMRLEKHQFTAVTSEPVTAVKWMDTKEVNVLSTAHQPRDVMLVKRTQKDGTRKEVLCPKAIASYTLSMGGVDLFDHFRSSYPIDRKSRKYWMRLLFFMFDASIINAYITYNDTHVATLHGHRDFRLRLARALVDNHTTRKVPGQAIRFKNKKGGVFGVPDEVRLLNVGIHLPEEIRTYKRCKFCSLKKKEQRTKIQCSTCNVSLCAKTCFKAFHTAPSEI